jgi:rhamnose utilization protein RhaD (predicted bifunctional aldolase and dehydrogenase)/NAD(P)-dependent dehydrogenase (short-subunit alcohol dehydrogenase family)
MKSRWSDAEASEYLQRYAKRWNEPLALRTYTSRLLGGEEDLVLCGGGNTSVKVASRTVYGTGVPAVFVKASGHDLAGIEPEGHTGLVLDTVRSLRSLSDLSDDRMMDAIRLSLLDPRAPAPSIEALLHAFLSPAYIDHTHADSILALTNQHGGKSIVREALGKDVIVLEYVKPGFALAKAAAAAFEGKPDAAGMVLMKHGLVTWGESAREAYERTVALVSRAEEYLRTHASIPIDIQPVDSVDESSKRYEAVAPLLRGMLATRTDDPDRPYRRLVLRPLITNDVLHLVGAEKGETIAVTPPLTADHLIRTKPFPLWMNRLAYEDEKTLRNQLADAIHAYGRQYEEYIGRNADRLPPGIEAFDSMPRVILMPGLGAACAGRDAAEADAVRAITRHSLSVKRTIASMGSYEGLDEGHLFDMEYFTLQHAKLDKRAERPLHRSTAVVTGAAGAIGAGICEALLEAGCHVAVTDLPGEALDSLVKELRSAFGERVTGVELDVTDPESVAAGFRHVIREWGGVDLVIPNAGLAHVSSIAGMDADAFRRLERVNVEGTLNIFSEAARHFKTQGTGGDIVFVSTKNVFAPGAKFGAYSATKAAAHQLARVASIELADIGVRVNMVSPDAIFSHGPRRSGLWAAVGPDRMRARGLDERGLEEYYQNRNLLKVKVTATHVARAVLFFATRQTPTTGATLPVDGGLPDSTPR